MKPITWTHGLGVMLICMGMVACTQQSTDGEAARAPAMAPETTTAPPVDTGTSAADPYATTPPVTETDSMTGRTDISGTETTGDTLGDRCAGFSGEALTECLEAESARRQDVPPPIMQDPTQTPPQDVPQQ